MIKKWTFDNDDLFDLVGRGIKRGTCCLYYDDESLSRVGETNIIYNSKNQQIKVKITNVRIVRFCDINKDWAITEGEGDLSLTYWKNIHENFFKNIKPDFKKTDLLELNEFVVI